MTAVMAEIVNHVSAANGQGRGENRFTAKDRRVAKAASGHHRPLPRPRPRPLTVRQVVGRHQVLLLVPLRAAGCGVGYGLAAQAPRGHLELRERARSVPRVPVGADDVQEGRVGRQAQVGGDGRHVEPGPRFARCRMERVEGSEWQVRASGRQDSLPVATMPSTVASATQQPHQPCMRRGASRRPSPGSLTGPMLDDGRSLRRTTPSSHTGPATCQRDAACGSCGSSAHAQEARVGTCHVRRDPVPTLCTGPPSLNPSRLALVK